MKKAPELLSPAGDFSAFLGAINAGADAVYLGGDAYGARAYAKNFSREEIVEALDYAHAHSKKIYLTVNTLTKNDEAEMLYDYLKPLYLAGLDGVIVQDLGVFSFIGKEFPDMALHVSTQMAVSSVSGAAMLKRMGASRVVPARELSLEEIKEINDLGIETECFIHGSMCYSYSGICLFSSFLGGRSGNRGRCAGPCRQPYHPLINENPARSKSGRKEEHYPLSLKDLCTLNLLPKLIDTGISSFKIEGRMKAAAYAAGTAAIYRKYIDLYLQGDKPYVVDKADLDALKGLYLRTDLQEGYYEKSKSASMVSVSSPSYNKTNDDYCAELNNAYCRKKEPVPLKADVSFIPGKEALLTVYPAGEDTLLTVSGDSVLKAEKAPLQKEDLIKRFRKSSEGLYSFDLQNIECAGDAFLPVGSLNALRRKAEEELLLRMHQKNESRPTLNNDPSFWTVPSPGSTASAGSDHSYAENGSSQEFKHKIFVSTSEQLKEAICFIKEGDAIVIPTAFAGHVDLTGSNVPFFYSLPFVYRSPMKESLKQIILKAEENSLFEGCYCNQTDTAELMRSFGTKKKIICDYAVLSANNGSIRAIETFADAFTADIELNRDELLKLNLSRAEMFAYGKIPLMQSANCVLNTFGKCRKGSDDAGKPFTIKDRRNISFTVFPHCNEKVCYNTIYNSVPISLHKHYFSIKELGIGTLQLRFTDESASETRRVLGIFDHLRSGETVENVPYDFTNGHFMKGVL